VSWPLILEDAGFPCLGTQFFISCFLSAKSQDLTSPRCSPGRPSFRSTYLNPVTAVTFRSLFPPPPRPLLIDNQRNPPFLWAYSFQILNPLASLSTGTFFYVTSPSLSLVTTEPSCSAVLGPQPPFRLCSLDFRGPWPLPPLLSLGGVVTLVPSILSESDRPPFLVAKVAVCVSRTQGKFSGLLQRPSKILHLVTDLFATAPATEFLSPAPPLPSPSESEFNFVVTSLPLLRCHSRLYLCLRFLSSRTFPPSQGGFLL